MVTVADNLTELIAEVLRLREKVTLYQPIAEPVLRQREFSAHLARRAAQHTHFCWSCSDGSAAGRGCGNCRQTGFEQSPCLNCPGPQIAPPDGSADT